MRNFGEAMIQVTDFLETVAKGAYDRFRQSRSVLSFAEYLALVVSEPKIHLRHSAQYFLDMIEKFGTYEIASAHRHERRYRLFDAEFSEGEGRIFGHEAVQDAIVRYLRNFVRSGRVDKLLLLHGPNGSAKTSLVMAMARAVERYSELDEGATYQFSWIFPKKDRAAHRLGFKKDEEIDLTGFARCPADEIDAQVVSEERDHPLLLLPIEDRKQLLSRLEQTAIPQALLKGELSHKNAQVYNALLLAHNGDLAQVLRHVRVERFYFSRRYRRGLSVVEPQMSVDAYARQVTSDQSMGALPANLRHLSLFEMIGPLVEANRGLIEYSDLLKRPIDSWKYLLVACEQAQVSVGSISLFLDLLMIATSNELHLASFKEYPDWPSFKGRIELIRVPYLLNSSDESGIYFNQIPKALHGIHIAPHAIEMAARWAVLTRLEAPKPERYPEEIQEIVRDLAPEEKLDLYEKGEVPVRLSQKQALKLRGQVANLRHEYVNEINYEGRYGASPREILNILLLASQDGRYDHLSVGGVFEQIQMLIEQHSSFDFLRREPIRGYRDAIYLLHAIKAKYWSIIEEELHSSLGVYRKDSYVDLFSRYLMHVSAWTKKETLVDPVMQQNVHADERFMYYIEERLLAQNEQPKEFREQTIAEVAAFRLENPKIAINLATIFPSHLTRLKASLYREQRPAVLKAIALLMHDNDDRGADERDRQNAEATLENLYKLGYNTSSARFAMAFYLSSSVDAQEGPQKSLKFD